MQFVTFDCRMTGLEMQTHEYKYQHCTRENVVSVNYFFKPHAPQLFVWRWIQQTCARLLTPQERDATRCCDQSSHQRHCVAVQWILTVCVTG